MTTINDNIIGNATPRSAVIVIPVYKSSPSVVEQISLRQCRKILGIYPTYIVSREGVDIEEYRAILGIVSRLDFPAEYFRSIQSYSALLCSEEFYAPFLPWEYMLLYQPDCYVFRDELAMWCRQDYDYIGAPWITFDWLQASGSPLARFPGLKSVLGRVGNGGFSLRKVGRFYELSGLIGWVEKKLRRHEDLIWSNVPRWFLRRFEVPDVRVALGFSFDQQPSLCYALAGKKLPFGCHGWYKTDRDFWSQFLTADDLSLLRPTEEH